MSSILVHKTHIKKSHFLWKECDFLCFVSKNLYNTCLYQIRDYGFSGDDNLYEKKNSENLNSQEKPKNIFFLRADTKITVNSKTKEKTEKKINRYAFETNEIYKVVKNLPEYRTINHQDYFKRQINTKILKQSIRHVSQDFSNYFASIIAYKKDPSPFTGEPKWPQYKTKGNEGRNVCTIPIEAISIKKDKKENKTFLSCGSTHIKMDMDFIKDINGNILTKDNILEIKIVPCISGYDILISYLNNLTKEEYKKLKAKQRKEKFDKIKKNKKGENNDKLTPQEEFQIIKSEFENKNPDREFNFASCDLGLNNLMALTSNNPGVKPAIVNGRHIKSINQYYNKKLAQKKSLLAKNRTYISVEKSSRLNACVHEALYEPVQTLHGFATQKTSDKVKTLTQKRNHKISSEFHLVSKKVVQWLQENNISCLIIGKNQGWKDKINMGKSNNQKFAQVPFNKLIQLLQYKCQRVGISVILTEESYTSKTSFLDMEEICFHKQYKGRRIHRGMFKSSSGKFINADVNASYNIGRKVAGDKAYSLNQVETLAVRSMHIFW